MSEIKRVYLVTTSFLCRTLGTELRRTVQFPVFLPASQKITTKTINEIKEKSVALLERVYGINPRDWNVTYESIIPLFIGQMTEAEFEAKDPVVPVPDIDQVI